jgi:hypothetical protein
MRDRRLELGWDRQLEYDGHTHLPDCRLRNSDDRVQRGRMWWDKVYCANCGRLYGLVTSDWTPHVFAVCNECVSIMGEPPGAQRVET